ncbi:SCO family protein [Sphingomicrobium lutaoense]|uniref:Protein SCO1/2 n=1 Tax=Sphingomicrobium lutaoense TaxID=515949 RepID=A0A839Z0Q5_9SPHN|nr:SCO family protein [Sphingomicrobium lutaoense]MBB3763262.1 protein SCO1/2 [Sphingomicrobium lutaoense]
MSLSTVRMILWALVAAVAVGAGLMWINQPEPTESAMDFQSSIGGEYELVASDGEPFRSASLEGRPHAVFFGFTHCPDVCPTTLARLAKLRREVGEDAFDILFITVDPERDGPSEVGEYARLFDTPVIGLTGSEAQIGAVKKQFAVHSEKVPDGEGGYSVDHSAAVFLMDSEGRFIGTLTSEEGREAALAKLERLASS